MVSASRGSRVVLKRGQPFLGGSEKVFVAH